MATLTKKDLLEAIEDFIKSVFCSHNYTLIILNEYFYLDRCTKCGKLKKH